MVSIKIKPSKKTLRAVKRPEPKLPETDFSKPWAIWLDDERPIPARSGMQYVAAANPRVFIDLIEDHGIPSFISFDWYLGSGWDNGEAVIKWLIESDQLGMHSFPEDFLFDVHSSDHTKNRAMNALLSDYLISKGSLQYFKPRSPTPFS
jgi:hypothetical protein